MDRDNASPICLRCGYLLVGIDPRRPCPECGLLAGLSLIENPELRHNRPRWLAGLTAGAWLLTGGAPLALMLPLALGMMSQREIQVNPAGIARIGVNWPAWIGGFTMAAWATGSIAGGVWLLTRSSGRAAEDAQSRPMRIGLRILALVPLAVVMFWAGRGPQVMAASIREPQVFWSFLVLLVAFSGIAGLLFAYLKSLAARAPAPLLAADSPVVGYVLAVCLLFPLVFAAITSANRDLFPRGSEGLAMYVLFAIWAAVGATSLCWAIYLLIRYALAFGRSARQARELMREHDAAASQAMG